MFDADKLKWLHAGEIEAWRRFHGEPALHAVWMAFVSLPSGSGVANQRNAVRMHARSFVRCRSRVSRQ